MTNSNDQWNYSPYSDDRRDTFGNQSSFSSQTAYSGQNPYAGQSGTPYSASNDLPGGITAEERTWAMLAHISAVIAMFVSAGWLSFVGPLLVWIVQKDKSPYVRQAAAQSFNFNLGMGLASIVAWIMFFTIILIPVSIIIWLFVVIATLWHHIRATLKAGKNEGYKYPFQIKILS